jgi:hypothetical protein
LACVTVFTHVEPAKDPRLLADQRLDRDPGTEIRLT